MMVSIEKVTARATELYSEMKRKKGYHGYTVTNVPELPSDQAKAVIAAIVEAMNHELMNPIVVHYNDDVEDDGKTESTGE